MLICLDLCSHMSMCLDLCSLYALCYIPCACVLHAMFVCLGLGYICHAMCYCSPFIALSFFLVFWPIGSELIWDLWSLSSSVHLGPYQRVWITHICMSCLLAFMLYACVSLSSSRLSCLTPLARLWLCGYVRHPWGLVRMQPIGMHCHEAGCSVHTFPLFRSMPMLVCATRWLSVHLYTLDYMSMHESCLLVCRPCFNTMKLWTSDLSLHLSPMDTTFC